MRSYLKPYFIVLSGLAFVFSAVAQGDSKYKAEAALIRKDVWAWNKPEFNVRSIPAEFSNASKVVIARHMDVNADSKKHMGLRLGGLAVYRELILNEVLREAVKINDKSAVSEYSEISYTQLQRKGSYMMDKTTVVYIGVRVIKTDGSMKEIDADDIVLTKDQKKSKEAKIAIPDLQVGDIVDYFISKQTNMSQLESIPPYLFTFYENAPVMYCSMHFEIGKKYALEYRCYNGAPDFKQTKGDDGENILDVSKTNIPAVTENNLWIAAYRQLPIIRMNIIVGYKGIMASRINARRPGTVYKNQDSDEFIEDKMRELAFKNKTSSTNFGLGKTTSDYLKFLRKNRDNMSEDSLAKELFYLYRFSRFCEHDETSRIDGIVELPKADLNESILTYWFSVLLHAEKVENYLVFSTGNNGPRMKEIMSPDDLGNIAMVRGAKSQFFGMQDIFTAPQYVPYYYENSQQSVAVNTRGVRGVTPKDFEVDNINIPGTKSEQNSRIEKLTVSLAADPNYLHVNRNTTLKGHYKSDEQKRLILFEDYYESERKLFKDDKTMIERLAEGKKTKKFSEELKAAFDIARSKHKESFIEEAKNWFEQDIRDFSDYKVENMGIRHTKPDFVYSSQFNVGGMVKKAGSNYIIDIGKLQGSPLKIAPEQRKRTLDIYAPFARSMSYQIILQIPDGYVAEGIANLNKKIQNETGYFICEATGNEKSVTINISKSYNKSFERAANWNQMLEFIDAATDWGNTKLLLKKKS